MQISYNLRIFAPANYMPIGIFDSREAPLAMMGFFGKMPIHLVSNIRKNYADGDYNTTTFTYRMQDGLPVSIDCTAILLQENNPKSTDFSKITLEWN